MASWLTPQTIGGVLAALGFAALCHNNWRSAILAFTAAGCIRNVEIGAFSGSDIVQGLLPVEVLASVMFLTWRLERSTRRRDPIRRTPFNRSLLLLLPVSVISLIAGFAWYDPTIPLDHVKLSVSLGQILLTGWPIATYFVVANSVHDTKTIQDVRTVIVVLALPSLLLIGWPAASNALAWSTSFALPASSICFAECFETRSRLRKTGLLIVTFAPVLYGMQMGKAFYYAYCLVSSSVIAAFQARRMTVAIAPFAFAAYILAVPVMTGSLTPRMVTHLVEHEEAEQSIGGTGGRDHLIVDGLGIWSRYPIFGVGPGNNYPYMLRYSNLGTAHNQYINILIELGVVGLLCFVAFAYSAFRTGMTLFRTAQIPAHRRLALAWLGIFAGMLVGGFFGDFMLPSIRNSGLELFAEFYVQWIVLGLIVSATAIERHHSLRAMTL
jgi:hypothetical protein